jgi:cytochrome c553
MKKGYSIFICTLVVLVWSCAHKISPAATAGNTSTTTPMAGSTAPAGNTESATPDVAKTSSAAMLGQTTYTAKCGRCHELKVTTDYTTDRWVGIMQSMAPKAQLNDAEKENVLAYVQANAKK